jgi:hypothetical protein
MNMVRTISLALASAMTLALAGCAAPGASLTAAPNYDLQFGNAVREARMRMTLNPGAASTDPVAGIDGPAARLAQDRYHETFKSPPPPVSVINIGGALSQGGQ